MNLNDGDPTLRLLDNHYDAAMSDMEVELCPTKYGPQNPKAIGRSSEDSSLSNTKRHISDAMSRAIKSYQLVAALEQNRSRSWTSILRFGVALVLCTLPIIIFSVEMIPGRCKICLDNVELTTYFVTSALCGGIGAMLLSHDWSKYSFARFLGGAIGSIGALFTMWMIMQTLPPIDVLGFIFPIVGMVGAMPGLIAYFLVKTVLDEFFVPKPQDTEDDISSLTTLMIVEK